MNPRPLSITSTVTHRLRSPLIVAFAVALVSCAGGGTPTGEDGNNPGNNGPGNNGPGNNGPACSASACSIGEVICAGLTQVVECVDDGSGCGSFQLVESCLGGSSCSAGECVTGCIDRDGDQHGDGCDGGRDCDDNDSDRFHGADEACDEKDNDCDGQTDEGGVCQGEGCEDEPCQPPERECVDGENIRECRANADGCGEWSDPVACGGTGCQGNVCTGCDDADGDQRGEGCALGSDCDDNDNTRYEGAPELCDGLDNDCDGPTDEDFNVGDTCTAGIGACAATGQFICDSGQMFTICNATGTNPGTELCGDNVDNDCDEDIDEGFENVGNTCTDGSGSCVATGTFVCTNNGMGVECSAMAEPGGDEVCDGNDNDCDGPVDEGGVCDMCVEDQYEDNDGTGSATDLPSGTSLSAVMCGSGGASDRDWFRLGSFTPGQSMTVQLDFDTPGARMHMEIYTGSFQTGSAPSSSSHSLSHTATESGNHYLWVFPNDNVTSGTPYTITHQ